MDLVLNLIDQELLLHGSSSSKTSLWNTCNKRLPILFPGSSCYIGSPSSRAHLPICIAQYLVEPGQLLKPNQKVCSILYLKEWCHLRIDRDTVFLRAIAQPGLHLKTSDVFIGMSLGCPKNRPDVKEFRRWYGTVNLLRARLPSPLSECALEQKMEHVRALRSEFNASFHPTRITLIRSETALHILFVLIHLFYAPHLLKSLSATSLKDIEQILAICATSFTFSVQGNFESPAVHTRRLYAEYKNFIRPFYRSKSGGSVDIALEFSKASFKTSIFGPSYWEYRVLGDAELFFDETKNDRYLIIYHKFIKSTIYSGITKEAGSS